MQVQGSLLITGATGFVGRALCSELRKRRRAFRAVVRSNKESLVVSQDESPFPIEGLNVATDWEGAFAGITTIVHLAARVHVMNSTAAADLAAFRAVNVAGTLRLAEQAAAAGVRRFVFVSSVKVHGEANFKDSGGQSIPFIEDMPCMPVGAYGTSKWEAEQALRALAVRTGMELVILRPTLVYAPGVGANFQRLIKLVESGLPLPLKSVKNRRSLVYVGNLVDVIIRGCDAPIAAGEVFLVSDQEDQSTVELITKIAQSLGSKARLVHVPVIVLKAIAKLVGRRAEAERIIGSLIVDSSKLCRLLKWSPPFSVAAGVAATVAWHLAGAQVSPKQVCCPVVGE